MPSIFLSIFEDPYLITCNNLCSALKRVQPLSKQNYVSCICISNRFKISNNQSAKELQIQFEPKENISNL